MKYVCVNEFGQVTEMTEFAVLSFLANSSKWDHVDALNLLKQGKRLYINEHDVYIERID